MSAEEVVSVLGVPAGGMRLQLWGGRAGRGWEWAVPPVQAGWVG